MSIYISDEALVKVKTEKYGYKSTDLAITNTVMGWFWNFLIDYVVPSRLAPNAITFLGFFIMLSNLIITCYYALDLTNTLPQWVIAYNCFGVFMRQTLDAIDGKQARKTGALSPLGEILDHGLCDPIELLIAAIICASLLDLGLVYPTFLFVLTSMSSHFLEMWAIYLTGKLEFWYISFQESELMGVAAHIVVYIYGKAFLADQFEVELSGYKFMISYSQIIWYSAIIQFVIAIYSGFKRGTEVALKKNDTATRIGIFALTFPGVWIAVWSTLWANSSPTLIYSKETGVPFLLTLGVLFSYCILRTVTARVCHFAASRFYYVLLPLPFGYIITVGEFGVENLEKYFVWGYGVFVALAWVHCALSITLTLANTLNATLFILPAKKEEKKN